MNHYATPEIDAHEGLRLVHDGCLLLDVREDHEWSAGHAPAAVHVPSSALPTAPLPSWSASPIVVVCRSGNRSKAATDLLRHRGVQAFSLAGGMHAWRAAGGDVVTSAGGPGTIV